MDTATPPRPSLQQLLIGDLAPAIRHLDRLRHLARDGNDAVYGEIEASIERCVERIKRDVRDLETT